MVFLRQRAAAKWIGWIDLILLFFYLCIISIVIYSTISSPVLELVGKSNSVLFSSISVNNRTLNLTEFSTDLEQKVKILWIEAGINISCSIIQIIAAILLIDSTSNIRKPQSALKLVSFWMIVSAIVFVSYLILRAIAASWISLGVGVIIRGVFIFFVGRYFQELRDATRIATTPVGIESNTTNDNIGVEPVPVAVISQPVEKKVE